METWGEIFIMIFPAMLRDASSNICVHIPTHSHTHTHTNTGTCVCITWRLVLVWHMCLIRINTHTYT